jgi:hypothetical protein
LTRHEQEYMISKNVHVYITTYLDRLNDPLTKTNVITTCLLTTYLFLLSIPSIPPSSQSHAPHLISPTS